MAITTLTICVASSRVGARISAWQSRLAMSMFWSRPMVKVAVFPVPDWAWAIVSRIMRSGLIARCWIADGFSKP